MQIPKCIKQNNPCDIHSRKTRFHHSCGKRIFKGRKMSDSFKKKLSERNKKLGIKPPSRLGMVPWNKGLKGFRAGEKSHLWKGGISKINRSERMNLMQTIEYKLWRTSVFERDNYTCIWCGQRGGKLQADHIKPFALFPELRLAIDNGRTLCIGCHRKIGWKGSHLKKN